MSDAKMKKKLKNWFQEKRKTLKIRKFYRGHWTIEKIEQDYKTPSNK